MNTPKHVAAVSLLAALVSSPVAFGVTTATTVSTACPPAVAGVPAKAACTVAVTPAPAPAPVVTPPVVTAPVVAAPAVTPAAPAKTSANRRHAEEDENGDANKDHEGRMVLSATLSGNTLTVSSISHGRLKIGSQVTGKGIPPGTRISEFGTGEGGVGTYTVSTSND